MMPRPNPNKRINNHNSEYSGRTQDKILLETKPSFWLYSDNFILKIVVLFIMVFLFSPIMTLVYTLHSQLVANFHLEIDNVMFYTELILIILVAVVIIKLILDILDWNSTNYIFTESRIVIQRGFVHKEKIVMSYNKIQDIEINRSILERLMGVGDIIIYGANEISDTVLYDIPSPKKVEDIILSRLDSIGFGNQNYMNSNYQQQPNYNPQYQQPEYNPQYQQQRYNPQNQQAGYNGQYQQTNYQQDPGYIQPDHNMTNDDYNSNYQQQEYIQPEPEQYDNNYDDEVITPERQVQDRWDDGRQTKSTQKLDKNQILRKHDQMFKKHKK